MTDMENGNDLLEKSARFLRRLMQVHISTQITPPKNKEIRMMNSVFMSFLMDFLSNNLYLSAQRLQQKWLIVFNCTGFLSKAHALSNLSRNLLEIRWDNKEFFFPIGSFLPASREKSLWVKDNEVFLRNNNSKPLKTIKKQYSNHSMTQTSDKILSNDTMFDVEMNKAFGI